MIFREDGVNGTTGVTQFGSHHAGPVIGGTNMGDQGEGAAGNAAGLYGSASGSPASLRAVGDDVNAGINVQSKGLGVVQLVANSQQRYMANPVSKTITDTGAVSLFDVACDSAVVKLVGGSLDYLVEASDGTDYQAKAGVVHWAAVNKAAALTLSIVEDTAAFATAVSAGTLTLAWTFVAGTQKGTVKVTPTGSLTETTPYRITYTVRPIVGAVTIL